MSSRPDFGWDREYGLSCELAMGLAVDGRVTDGNSQNTQLWTRADVIPLDLLHFLRYLSRF